MPLIMVSMAYVVHYVHNGIQTMGKKKAISMEKAEDLMGKTKAIWMKKQRILMDKIWIGSVSLDEEPQKEEEEPPKHHQLLLDRIGSRFILLIAFLFFFVFECTNLIFVCIEILFVFYDIRIYILVGL
eukprot:1158452_1